MNLNNRIKEQLQQSIELLRQKVNINLDIIHNNEGIVRALLQNEPVCSSRSEKLEMKFNENKKLLEDNHEAINLQLSIIKYLEQVKHIQPIEIHFIDPNTSEADLFEMTIRGDLVFNSTHPMYNDTGFFEKLIDYYTNAENYEMCGKLVKMKS